MRARRPPSRAPRSRPRSRGSSGAQLSGCQAAGSSGLRSGCLHKHARHASCGGTRDPRRSRLFHPVKHGARMTLIGRRRWAPRRGISEEGPARGEGQSLQLFTVGVYGKEPTSADATKENKHWGTNLCENFKGGFFTKDVWETLP